MYPSDNQINEDQNNDGFTQKKGKFVSFLKKQWEGIKSLGHIHESTDVDATTLSIQKSVNFRGVNLWLLGFAIIIASVGLNVNSTAVIIGAMLISPLMGPIMGVGLAVGTYDWDLLKRSFRNLLLMVGISLLASTLYFLLSPLGDARSELLARTRPTIYDVLIATFGGLAGIVAASRKESQLTVVSGVAIATALMPPLCTAGYGLATWQLKYATGAFYLFFINSFFIALATFIMVRYLRFPIHKFLDKKREKNVKRIIIALVVVVTVPSVITAISVVRESVFDSQVAKFVAELRDGGGLKSTQQIVDVEKEYNRKTPVLTLSIVGDEVSPVKIDSLRTLMREEFGLNTTDLRIRQSNHGFNAELQASQLGRMVSERDQVIKEQEQEIATLSVGTEQNRKAAQQVGDKYASSIANIAVSSMPYYQTSGKNTASQTTVIVTWREGADREAVSAELKEFMPLILQVDKVKIVSAN